MFVYFKNSNNDIIYVSEIPVAHSPDQLLTPEGHIPAFADTYSMVELNVTKPYKFTQSKYKLEDNKIVYKDSFLENEDKWDKVRIKRDELLRLSDQESGVLWVDFWNTKDEVHRNAWTLYRQALRDLPQSVSNPDDVSWPEKPN